MAGHRPRDRSAGGIWIFLILLFLSHGLLILPGLPRDACAQDLTHLQRGLWIRAVTVDPQGNTWISLDRGGIMVLDPGTDPLVISDNRWARINMNNSELPNSDPPVIAPEGERGVWIGTVGGGIAYLDHGTTPLDLSDDVWAWYMPGTTGQGLPNDFVYSILVQPDGLKWLGTQKGGLTCLNDNHTPLNLEDDQWLTFNEQDGLTEKWVYRITPAGPTSRWIATWGGGLFLFDDNGTPFEKSDDRWANFSKNDGLPGDKVRTAAVGPSGTVWVATLGGLSLLDTGGTPFNKGDDRWTHFSQADGLPGINVMDVCVGQGNKKWIAVWGGGLACLDDNGTPHDKTDDTWTLYDESHGLTELIVRRLHLDTRGLIWIATWGNGLLVR